MRLVDEEWQCMSLFIHNAQMHNLEINTEAARNIDVFYLQKRLYKWAWNIRNISKCHNCYTMPLTDDEYKRFTCRETPKKSSIATLTSRWRHYMNCSTVPHLQRRMKHEVQVRNMKHMWHEISRIVNKTSTFFIIVVPMTSKLVRLLNSLAKMGNMQATGSLHFS